MKKDKIFHNPKINLKKLERQLEEWDKDNVAPTLMNIVGDRDFCYITPDEYLQMQKERGDDGTVKHTKKELVSKAKSADKGRYCHCGLRIWELPGCDMCFTCTTGETDPSDDFELTMNPNKQPHYQGEQDA